MPVSKSDVFSFVLLNVRMLLSGLTSDTKSGFDFKTLKNNYASHQARHTLFCRAKCAFAFVWSNIRYKK